MKKCRIILRALLLAALFCSLQSTNLFAQSTQFLLSPDLNKSSLTHTVFHGSNRHYDTTPSSSGEDNFSADFLSNIGTSYSAMPNTAAILFTIGRRSGGHRERHSAR